MIFLVNFMSMTLKLELSVCRTSSKQSRHLLVKCGRRKMTRSYYNKINNNKTILSHKKHISTYILF